MNAMFSKWAARYKGQLRKRFEKFSKGGGNWRKLKHRKGNILWDTGLLYGALGEYQKRVGFSIVVGYGGNSGRRRHSGGKARIVDIATWHNFGTAVLPVRQIIVMPDRETIRGMADDAEQAMIRVLVGAV